jgi:hypothetical protein
LLTHAALDGHGYTNKPSDLAGMNMIMQDVTHTKYYMTVDLNLTTLHQPHKNSYQQVCDGLDSIIIETGVAIAKLTMQFIDIPIQSERIIQSGRYAERICVAYHLGTSMSFVHHACYYDLYHGT